VTRVGLRSIVLVVVLAAGCASGESTSPTPTAPTAPTPPSAPPPTPPPPASCRPGAASNLNSTLVGSTRTLTWTAGANATDYDIQIGYTSGGSEIVRDNTTHTSYQWTGGGSGTTGTFYARVHSHNSCGSGPPSVELVFH
jgi:type 1 fimbria pilin